MSDEEAANVPVDQQEDVPQPQEDDQQEEAAPAQVAEGEPAVDVGADSVPPAEDQPQLEAVSEEPEAAPAAAEADETNDNPPPVAQQDEPSSSAPETNENATAVQPFFADPAEGSILIRFIARPEGFFVQQRFPYRAPGLVLYKRLQMKLHLERTNVQLYWEGRPINDADVPAEICVVPEGDDIPLCIDMEIESVPSFLEILAPQDEVLKAIRTSIHYGDDIPAKQFYVTLVKSYAKKLFLGGYRHTKESRMYHHAATQCSAEKQAQIDFSGKMSRTTQTHGVTRSCQTRRECATQMPRPDLLVDDTYDRVRVARPYYTADRLAVLQVQKTVQLQAFVRGWRARKIAKKLRNEKNQEEQALNDENQRRQDDHQRRREDELDRRTHPRSAQDFAVLHSELEAWRLQEVQRIKEANISEEERRVAMMELLKKQTKLLQTIDRLQIQATKEKRFQSIHSMLNKMSSAKKWGSATQVNVETPFTIRARELKDLYNGLQLTGVGIDERLDLLLHVKWTVKEFECALTREIVELVDREADLLNRGRKEGSLTGLRQRLSNLFLQFVETPEFNPEAAQYLRAPLEYSSRPLVKLDRK